MHIRNFKINGFGKLKNKEISLSNGINIIYGENEAGKSSMLKFISSMLYGASKTKNGKDISDFDRYKPWDTEEFSGKISYDLDNGEKFEVFREFKKKNPIIYNSQKEDISKEFPLDKTKGIEFFKEQTGIDEEIFYSTAITEQEGIKLSKSSQNSIIQKISNLVSTGDDNISYKRVIDKVNKRQSEEVGTDRTMQKPINLVNNKINKLMNRKKELEIYKENIDDSFSEKAELIEEERIEETKKAFLKEVKSKLDNNRLKSAEINLNKNLEKEYNQKIEELNKRISQNDTERIYQKADLKNYYIAIVIFIITFIFLMILNHGKLFFINFITFIPVLLILNKINKEKEKVNQNNHIEKHDVSKLVSELEVLKQSSMNQRKEVDEKEKKLLQDTERENKELIDKYIEVISKEYMQSNIVKSYDEILREIENKENRINSIRFKIQTIENRYEEINNKLDDLAQIEEELADAEEERKELLSLNVAFEIAKDCLVKAYDVVKENISPKFTENLSDIISKISNNRYSNVVLNDTDGLMVELQNGSYVPAERLSVGTIDQMYLSLRLSALNEITTEKIPIILDEAFAYFDEERMKNIFRYLDNNFKDNQIIIFTCSNREEKVLKDLNINYNYCKI